jgi:hypothetical protein
MLVSFGAAPSAGSRGSGTRSRSTTSEWITPRYRRSDAVPSRAEGRPPVGRWRRRERRGRADLPTIASVRPLSASDCHSPVPRRFPGTTRTHADTPRRRPKRRRSCPESSKSRPRPGGRRCGRGLPLGRGQADFRAASMSALWKASSRSSLLRRADAFLGNLLEQRLALASGRTTASPNARAVVPRASRRPRSRLADVAGALRSGA